MEHYYGKVLHGHYELTDKIGRGGMATVYRARDRDAQNSYVVVKQNDSSNSPSDHAQFEKEAQVLIEASAHPQCPRRIPLFRAYFVETEEGWNGQYVVMNYIEGEDMQSLMERIGRPLKYEDALYWLVQVMEVLEFLHAHTPPIFHRDIKPSNIRISSRDAIAYLIDFGIAGISSQQIVTIGFSPPEQYDGLDRCDARSDVYALGATLYCLLTGIAPPDARARQPSTTLTLSPNIVRSLNGRAAIERALQLDPAARFASVAEMRRAFQPDMPAQPPKLQIIADPPIQLVMPPTIKRLQPVMWWSDQGARMMRMALTPGNHLITGATVSGDQPSPLRLWSLSPRWDAPGQLLDTQMHPQGITSIATSRDGAWVASGDWLGTIQVWNIQNERLHFVRKFFGGHRGAVSALAFSPDGIYLAASSPPPGGIIQLWELHRQVEVPIVLARDVLVRGLAFSPDGTWLAAACDDSQVRLWNMTHRTEETGLANEMRNLMGAALAVTFSPNGETLAVGGEGRSVHLFDLRDRQTRATLKPAEWKHRMGRGAHFGRILQLAFSPTSDYVATAGDATQISIWDVSREQHAPSIGPFFEQVVGVTFGNYWHLMVAVTEGGAVALIRLL